MNGDCEYVRDGRDTDGTVWYRCTTHNELAPSPDAPCAGYEEIPYTGGPQASPDEQVRELASRAYKAMERATREDGTEYTRKRDDAPGWVATIVQDAHGDMLPDDWRYECIRDAFSHIADYPGGMDLDEAAHEFADAADVYNSDLLTWVGSHGSRAGYVDEAIEEFGPARDFYHSLQMGQYQERSEVFGSVLSGLRNVAALVEAVR